MKLRTKIAGTLALPLALAVAANVNAAQITDELQVSGFIAATADWKMYDEAEGQDSDVDFGLSLGTSRLGVTYVKNGVTYQYENDWNGLGREDESGDKLNSEYRLRHAVIKYDGWEAGYTWSGFANRTALAETIDATGPTSFSANANRTAKLGKSFNVANGMKVGVFLEDHSHPLNSDSTSKEVQDGVNSAIPDVTLNFDGNFGDTKVFAAARLLNVDDTNYAIANAKKKTKIAADFAVGVSQNLLDDNLNIKLAVLSLDKDENGGSFVDNTGKLDLGTNRSTDGRDLGAQLGVQYKFNDQIRTNLVFEHVARDNDLNTNSVWLNSFYTMNNGWEWGAEFRYVAADSVKVEDPANAGTFFEVSRSVNGLADKDMSISLLAKYAF